MGHLVGKDVYRELGRKIDGLTARAPWSDKLRAMLGELYSEEDARLVAAMPCGFSRIARLEKVTGIPRATLEAQLDEPVPARAGHGCVRGRRLLLRAVADGDRDLRVHHDAHRRRICRWTAGRGCSASTWRRAASTAPTSATGSRSRSCGRVPHDGSIAPGRLRRGAGLREGRGHRRPRRPVRDRPVLVPPREASTLGGETCKTPLETCSSFGPATVGFMVRNGLAREVSKAEMLENIARSRDLGLVLNADNVQRNVTFMCHCCGCCCNVLRGISRHGYPNTVVTSSYIAAIRPRPLQRVRHLQPGSAPSRRIPRVPDPDPRFRKLGRPVVDEVALHRLRRVRAACASRAR